MDNELEIMLSKIASAKNQDDIRSVTREICSYFGFDSIALADIGTPHRIVPTHISNMALAWETTYKDEGFSQLDGVIPIARRTTLPFTWGDVKKPKRTRGRKPGALTVFDAASEFGFTDAIVLPFHSRDMCGRPRSAVTLLPWNGESGEFEKIYHGKKHTIHLTMLYLQQKIIDLLWSNPDQEQVDIWDLGDRKSLTNRERDVLSWAARGKTTYEISLILEISEDTAETHFKNALDKLDCNNRTHAVAKAIYLGLIDV